MHNTQKNSRDCRNPVFMYPFEINLIDNLLIIESRNINVLLYLFFSFCNNLYTLCIDFFCFCINLAYIMLHYLNVWDRYTNQKIRENYTTLIFYFLFLKKRKVAVDFKKLALKHKFKQFRVCHEYAISAHGNLSTHKAKENEFEVFFRENTYINQNILQNFKHISLHILKTFLSASSSTNTHIFCYYTIKATFCKLRLTFDVNLHEYTQMINIWMGIF